jgi:transposase InsO family protein
MKILETQHSPADLCAALGVSRSGYHAWKTRLPSARQRTDETLSLFLCPAHTASRQTYGSPRLLAALRQQGHRTSRWPAAGCVHHTDRGSPYASTPIGSKSAQRVWWPA